MNREQKAVFAVGGVLILVILVLLGSTYFMWKKSRLPVVPVDLLYSDAESVQKLRGGTTAAYAYYFDEEKDTLVRCPLTLPLDPKLENFSALVTLAFERLAESPSGSSWISPLPRETRVESVLYDASQKAIYLSLNEAYFRNHPGGTIEGWASLYAIVNTVCSLSPSIEKVYLLKQKHPVREGPGGWDYSRPFQPNETLVSTS